MCYNSNRSIQPSPPEQITLPLNCPRTPPLWGWEEERWVQEGEVCTQKTGGKLLQGFLCVSLLFFFSQGWLLTRLNSIYCMQLLKEVSWSTDNP